MGLFDRTETPTQQGNIGLTAALHWFNMNGYLPCLPITEHQDFDLVVYRDGECQTVQVKTTRNITEYGRYEVHLRVNGGNRSGRGKTKHFIDSDVDLLFVLTERGEMYLIPRSEINCRSSITLGEKYEAFKVNGGM